MVFGCVVVLNIGPLGLVAPRNERICTYSVTLLLNLKLLVR